MDKVTPQTVGRMMVRSDLLGCDSCVIIWTRKHAGTAMKEYGARVHDDEAIMTLQQEAYLMQLHGLRLFGSCLVPRHTPQLCQILLQASQLALCL